MAKFKMYLLYMLSFVSSLYNVGSNELMNYKFIPASLEITNILLTEKTISSISTTICTLLAAKNSDTTACCFTEQTCLILTSTLDNFETNETTDGWTCWKYEGKSNSKIGDMEKPYRRISK